MVRWLGVLSAQQEGLDSEHQHPHVAMHIYNPSVGMKVGESREHAGQSG